MALEGYDLAEQFENEAQALASQWQAVADARERQEREARRSVGGPIPEGATYYVVGEDDQRYLWRDNRRAIEPNDWEPFKNGRPRGWLVFVIMLIVTTLLAGLVLTCGLRADGSCWK